MEEDIRSDIEEFLEKTKEPFYNECEFQMYLALFLKEKGYKIFLEYSVPLDCAKIIIFFQIFTPDYQYIIQ